MELVAVNEREALAAWPRGLLFLQALRLIRRALRSDLPFHHQRIEPTEIKPGSRPRASITQRPVQAEGGVIFRGHVEERFSDLVATAEVEVKGHQVAGEPPAAVIRVNRQVEQFGFISHRSKAEVGDRVGPRLSAEHQAEAVPVGVGHLPEEQRSRPGRQRGGRFDGQDVIQILLLHFSDHHRRGHANS